ncbi:hypothetical protein B9Z55_026505 [Caenorhabditis nigoni]|uniref:Sdz-33 F-box domain-containing protein n=1 Tax=Caenorhabditis nigoni TaxID=1611254 RepID=A0A2G5T3N0_9PELO|nr:hypothetical protein B9Z55_026505 [Caenorhabditis nigoni]
MGNQGMTLGEWINGLSLIPDDAKDLIVDFFVGHIMSDIQLLKNIFPKRMSINITCEKEDPNEQDTLNAQNLLRAFIPDVQRIKLFRVPLEKNFSRQHIGMANLKELGLFYQVDLNLDEICSWNVENCTISTMTDRMSLRDLNRFFKLWIKGSNPKLRELSIHWKTEIIPDWNVLLRGLKAVETEAEEEEERKFTIRNIRGICAVIQIEYDEERARAVCTFSN